MLITLIQDNGVTAPLSIGVSEDQADAVIIAMATDGWRVLSKYYGRASFGPGSQPVVDRLQVALLEVSALPASAPMRVVVELGVAAAIRNAPLWVAAEVLARSQRDRDDQRQSVTRAPGHGHAARRDRLNMMH